MIQECRRNLRLMRLRLNTRWNPPKISHLPNIQSKLPHRDIVPSVFRAFRFFRAARIATGANGGRK